MQVLEKVKMSPRGAGMFAMAAGFALAASGVTRLFSDQPADQAELVDFGDYFLLSMFVVATVSMAPAFLALARYARSEKGAIVAAAGTAVLGLTCITSLVNGEDLSLFEVLAPLTNAAWFFGSIALAVSLKKAGRLPMALVVAVPLAWVATIPLSMFGGGLISGAIWLAIGYLLYVGEIERREPVPAIA